MHRVLGAALIAAGLPCVVSASVVISEVAWMGTSANPNAEWIELFNDGPVQDLSGWSLEAEDGSPVIALEGTIDTNGYSLLERTSDDTVPSVEALLIYTGSLANAGEVLLLRDADGVLVDRVDGSDGWLIGGDNETKETLQRSGTPPTGSFITAAPTPQGGGAAPTEKEAATQTKKSSIGSNVLYGRDKDEDALPPRVDPALTLVAPSERTVLARVPATYEVRAYRESGRETTVTDVVWNFGDGTVREGSVVEHSYQYPGIYAVTVTARRINFIEDVHDEARMVVTVAEPSIAITAATAAYVELENTGNNELDLSGFALRVGDSEFTVPNSTFILPGATVRFPSSVTGLTQAGYEPVAVLHPSGALAVLETRALIPPHVARTPAPFVATTPASAFAGAPGGPKPSETSSFTAVSQPVGSTLTDNAVARDNSAHFTQTALTGEALPKETGELWWWLLALGAAILTVLVAIVLVREEQKPELIEEFEIEGDE